MKKLIAITTILILVAGAVNAQTSANSSQSFSLTLNNVIDISVSGTPTATFSTASNYDNGVTISNGATVAIKSNKNWALSVKAAAANFTGTPSNIPCSVLQFSLANANSFTALSTTNASVTTGNKGAANTVVLDYKVAPGYEYEAGSYSLSVVYTATQQ